MAFGGGPHESGLAAAFLGIDLGAGSEQGLHRPDPTCARGRHQSRFTATQGEVGIGARGEQTLHHLAVAIDAS